MRAKGWLTRDERASFYLYRQRMGDHVQTGVVGAVAISDYLEGRVKKHEHTRPDKEDDRTRHTDAIGAHAGPVFLAYRGLPAIDALVVEATRRAPAVEFVAKDGIGHVLWVVDDPAEVARFQAGFRDVPASYIADGHHRAAAYARVARLRRERASGAVGATLDRFLAVHPQGNCVLDYNRLVRDLNGLGRRGSCDGSTPPDSIWATPWPERAREWKRSGCTSTRGWRFSSRAWDRARTTHQAARRDPCSRQKSDDLAWASADRRAHCVFAVGAEVSPALNA
jgi:hypothetical protein